MSVYLVARSDGGSPIYRQIRDALVSEIQAFYKAGETLPAENTLAQRFGVNRHTLRRAIDELVSEGLVERYHGKGVYVLEPAINYAIGSHTRFTETLHSQGKTTISRVMHKQVMPARGSVATSLQLDDHANVIFIETLRHVDNKPFCVISHFLPLNLFPDTLADYTAGSLHEFLNQRYHITLTRTESLISAVMPAVDDAYVLNMPKQSPVLRVKSLNLDSNSKQPVEYAVTRFRGDATQLSIKP